MSLQISSFLIKAHKMNTNDIFFIFCDSNWAESIETSVWSPGHQGISLKLISAEGNRSPLYVCFLQWLAARCALGHHCPFVTVECLSRKSSKEEALPTTLLPFWVNVPIFLLWYGFWIHVRSFLWGESTSGMKQTDCRRVDLHNLIFSWQNKSVGVRAQSLQQIQKSGHV